MKYSYVLKNKMGLCFCYDGLYREVTLDNIQGGQNDVIIYGSYREAEDDINGTETIEQFDIN